MSFVKLIIGYIVLLNHRKEAEKMPQNCGNVVLKPI
jgi:hypothetical protein